MAHTYYRIQHNTDSIDDLIGRDNISQLWSGEAHKKCEVCVWGIEVVDGDEIICVECDGAGQVEDVRHGVSVCASIEDLRSYFSGRSASLDNTSLIVVEGDVSDEDYDADDGAILIHPTQIVSVTPLTESPLHPLEKRSENRHEGLDIQSAIAYN